MESNQSSPCGTFGLEKGGSIAVGIKIELVMFMYFGGHLLVVQHS